MYTCIIYTKLSFRKYIIYILGPRQIYFLVINKVLEMYVIRFQYKHHENVHLARRISATAYTEDNAIKLILKCRISFYEENSRHNPPILFQVSRGGGEWVGYWGVGIRPEQGSFHLADKNLFTIYLCSETPRNVEK